jgi:hypothetical protein
MRGVFLSTPNDEVLAEQKTNGARRA